MPELPEVETTRRGIQHHVVNKNITEVVVRHRGLRWPVPAKLGQYLQGQCFSTVTRRGKYLLLSTAQGTLIIHLGMSGSLRIVAQSTPAAKHDHLDICFNDHTCLRLRDPRRFGAVLWTAKDPLQHKLLNQLGPEPLAEEFDEDYLFHRSRKRHSSIKQFIMNSKIVVGVGNIYANEALFYAGIRPTVPAGKVSKARYKKLVAAIKQVLLNAIASGGTTLQDFTASDGSPGYFKQQLAVYDRAAQPCVLCGKPILAIQQQGRASYYCPRCQR